MEEKLCTAIQRHGIGKKVGHAWIFTADEVAEILGKTRTPIYNAARRYGIGKKTGGIWIFSVADIEKLRALPEPGRPRKATTAITKQEAVDTIRKMYLKGDIDEINIYGRLEWWLSASEISNLIKKWNAEKVP